MKLSVLVATVMMGSLLFFSEGAIARGKGGGSKGSHVRVKSYTTKSGKHVSSHARTKANRSKHDNWTTKGNVNPYTGKVGTKEP